MRKVNKILLELYNDRKQLLLLSFLGYVGYLMEGIIPSDPNIIHATGLWIGIGSLAISGASLYLGLKASSNAADAAEENNRLTAEIARENLAFQKEQQKKLDEQKDIYRAIEFKNPYANMENQFAENVFEDLTVNQQQAQFEAQRGAQQRANIMQGLRGAAGASGIAGLAQSMANQGQLQLQRASASIGLQEQYNERMKAQGELQVQRGASAADLAERGGEAMLQTMEMDRQATLLGISMGESAGANAAAMQAQQNQIAAGAAEASMWGQTAAGFYGMAGQGLAGAGTATAAYAGSQ